MTLVNFLESKLFTSRINIYIAWVIATLLYLRQRVVPVINLSPIDLALQAGLIYGYFFAIIFTLRLLAFPIIFFAVGLQHWENVLTPVSDDGESKKTKNSLSIKIGKSLLGFTQRIIMVLGILTVFLFHPENIVYKVAPFGLVLVLFIYIVSSDDEEKPEPAVVVQKSEPVVKVENSNSSPMYVEIVNSNENPIEVKNSEYSPLYVNALQGGNPLPVYIMNGEYKNPIPLLVKVINDVQPLSVEVVNVVATRQDDD